jgi:hypothetical protein
MNADATRPRGMAIGSRWRVHVASCLSGGSRPWMLELDLLRAAGLN